MIITGANLGSPNTTTVDFGAANPGIITSDNGTTVSLTDVQVFIP